MGKMNTEIFIEKSKSKHGFLYNYDKTNFTNSKDKVIINCNIHGDFEQDPYKHILGRGCRECGFKKSSNWVNRKDNRKSKVSIENWIERCQKKYNNKFDYSKSHFNYLTDNVIIICEKHGEFEKTAQNHLKSGCTYCSKNQKLHIDDVKHTLSNNIYFDILSFNEYYGNRQKIEVSCKKNGHKMIKSIQCLLNNSVNCQFCTKKNKHTTEEWIKTAKNKHNNLYNYEKSIYINSKTKIEIICEKHGTFKQIPNSHIKGAGCKKCNKSIGEQIISDILNKNNITHICEKNFEGLIYKSKLYFDFFLPKYNLCIEFDGLQHNYAYEFFGGEDALKERKIRDLIKNNYCIDNNIKLVRLSYTINYKTKERISNIIEEKITNCLNEI